VETTTISGSGTMPLPGVLPGGATRLSP
jgi:hypothetical protein